MMKKILIGLLVLLLLPIVYAGELEVTRVRAYLNDDRDASVSKNEGTLEDVWVNDNILFRIDLKNTYNITVEDISIKGSIKQINDGDDLDKTLSDFDLDDGEETTKDLEFNLPDKLKEDEFDMKVTIDYTVNTTDYRITLNYTIQTKEIEGAVSTQKILENMSNVCVDIGKQYSTVIEKLGVIPEANDCQITLSYRNAELDISQKKLKGGSICDSIGENCYTETGCLNELTNRITNEECNVRVNQATSLMVTKEELNNCNSQIQNNFLSNLVFIGIAFGIGFWFKGWKIKQDEAKQTGSPMGRFGR